MAGRASFVRPEPAAVLGAGSRMVQGRDMCMVPIQKIRLNNIVHFVWIRNRQTVSQHQLHTKRKVHSEQTRHAVEMDPQAPFLLFNRVSDGLFTPCN
jgi:hypothetical protein